MSASTLFATGLGMGIVHVLTGPDHLSALATLSANVGSLEAFWYGARWGIGHSIGLLLVGGILIIIDFAGAGNDNGDDNADASIPISEYFESFCESIVGVFMILLGLYGLRTAYLKHRAGRQEAAGDITNTYINDAFELLSSSNKEDRENGGGTFNVSPSASSNDDHNEEERSKLSVENGEASLSLADVSYDETGTALAQKNKESSRNVDFKGTHSHSPTYHHDHLHCCGYQIEHCGCYTCFDRYSFSKPLLSLGIGIIHGVAGPGGVLGVIPAVQLHNLKLAIIYLGTFCASSTLTMGIYAALYGSCSSYISRQNAFVMEYRIEMFSAGLSLFVGSLWLFLLSIGKLHDIFP